MYKRLEDCKQQLDHLREKGIERGAYIGFNWEFLPYSVKLGCTTYIGAAPASGKTEFWFELLINLSCLHGWNHVIFSPETGDATDIYSELCHKYIGKKFIKGQDEMTEAERVRAEYFINEHFFVIDPVDEDLTVESFYDLIDKMERDFEKTIHTTTIDPWNELTEDFKPNDLGREDKYLSRILGYARKNARKTNRHNCIITHVRDQVPIKQDTIVYYPPASARDLAGGQVWFRKGLCVLTLWRPPSGLMNENGEPYAHNELQIRIAKSKPKGVSKNGVYTLFLDVEKYQYYYVDYWGNRVYSERHKNESNNFTPLTNDQLPF